jgi:hypothetical protein
MDCHINLAEKYKYRHQSYTSCAKRYQQMCVAYTQTQQQDSVQLLEGLFQDIHHMKKKGHILKKARSKQENEKCTSSFPKT